MLGEARYTAKRILLQQGYFMIIQWRGLRYESVFG